MFKEKGIYRSTIRPMENLIEKENLLMPDNESSTSITGIVTTSSSTAADTTTTTADANNLINTEVVSNQLASVNLLDENSVGQNKNQETNNQNQCLKMTPTSSNVVPEKCKPERTTRRNRNYCDFIKKSCIDKCSFEINGRHNEYLKVKNNFYYIENLKFPDCVLKNLTQVSKYHGTPWFHREYQPKNEQFENIQQKLHAELNDFYSFLKPLREDEIIRKMTFYCIADSIRKLDFVKQVKYYGSYSSKTYLPVSDIDLVVYCSLFTSELTLLFTIAEKLSYDGIIKTQFDIIPMCRIPLLKFNDYLTGLPINITLNAPHVMERSQYLKDNIKFNSHQMKILFFLKYYLLSKGTNQVFYGGIGSYSLALMVIRYFQEESVKELLRNENTFQDSILGFLLIGFLDRFGDVNFFKNHIISVQDEGDYIECDYQDRNTNSEKKSSVLRIKDHLEPWNDVSYGSFNSAEIMTDFQYLHDKFMKSDLSKVTSLFGEILLVVDSFIEYRNMLISLFRKWFADDIKDLLAGKNQNHLFQEFNEKRKVFQETNLHFVCKSNHQDKSLEFKIETQRSCSVLYDNHQEYDNRQRNDHRNFQRIPNPNPINRYHPNGMYIMERLNKVRFTSGPSPHNNSKKNKRSKTNGRSMNENTADNKSSNNSNMGGESSKFSLGSKYFG